LYTNYFSYKSTDNDLRWTIPIHSNLHTITMRTAGLISTMTLTATL